MDAGGHASPPPPPSRRKRSFCARCSKPASVCLCARFTIPPLDNSIGVTILQHNLEGKHALNSARVASLGLRRVSVVPLTDVLFHAEYTVRPLDPGEADHLGKAGLEKISNVAALGMALHPRSLDADVGDDAGVCSREGSCDSDGSTEVGSQRVSGDRAEEKSNRFAFTNGARCCSEDLDCYPENGSNRTQNSKGRNGVINEVSNFAICEEKFDSEPEPLRASPASIEEAPDAQFSPRGSGVYPHEESSGAEEGKVVVKSALYKVISSSNRLWVSLERTARPDLSWVLGKPLGKAALSNGFVVKKLQWRQLKRNMELEEREEFNLVIPPGSALLFPGKSSIELGAVDFRVKHLVVLDGTWDKAKRMYCENPWLQFLPHLKLELKAASLYCEVRHQPGPGCLSTIESIVYALKSLGNDMEGLDNLLYVFESMIEDQRRCKDEKFSRISQA